MKCEMRFIINKCKFVAHLYGDEWILCEEERFKNNMPTPVFAGD